MISKATVRATWKNNYPKDLSARAERSRQASQLVRAHPEFIQAPKVGLYYPLSWELDLLSLWEARPDAVCFPKVEDDRLVFYRVDRLSCLAPGYHGILEPPAQASQRVERWNAQDLLLVPGLGFDLKGSRVGSGKGFYDRFLAGVPSKKWGVGFDEQLSQDALAQEPLDVRMLAIVTERGIHFCE